MALAQSTRLLGTSTPRFRAANVIDDPEWIQVRCVQVVQNHQSDDVRGLALTCIGHVARMHKTINKVLVIPVLLKGLEHKTLSGRAQDALDDIDIYVQGSNLKNGG